jgi:hypothetical protein
MKPLPPAPGNHGLGTPVDPNQRDAATGNGHYGRDAAPVGGIAALGEHQKHEGERGENYDNTAAPHKPGGLLSKLGLKSDKTATETYADDTTDPNRHHQHLGRDAALGGGGVGLAEHGHRKNEREREYERGVGGPHIPGMARTHNLLHKEPPADHPAATGVGRSEADTDQDWRPIPGHNHGVAGAGTGTGPYSDTGTGVATRGPGTY